MDLWGALRPQEGKITLEDLEKARKALEERYPRWFQRDTECFLASRGRFLIKFALVLDNLWEDRAPEYPGRLETIQEAETLTPRIEELKQHLEREEEQWIPSIATFMQYWQEGRRGALARQLMRANEEMTKLGRQSFDCYQRGMQWATQDKNHLPDNLHDFIATANIIWKGLLIAPRVAILKKVVYHEPGKNEWLPFNEFCIPCSPVLSRLMKTVDSLVKAFFSHPKITPLL